MFRLGDAARVAETVPCGDDITVRYGGGVALADVATVRAATAGRGV